MKKLSQIRIGEAAILVSAVIGSLYPIVTQLSFRSLSPVVSLAWSMLFALCFFAVVSALRASWINFLKLGRGVFADLVKSACIFGVVFPFLQFLGLRYTSAGNVAVLLTLEVLFTFLFFNIWRKEDIDRAHVVGAVLMLASAVIILSPNFDHFQRGDFIILAAVMIPPVGNLFQRRARQRVSSDQMLLFRTMLATPLLFLAAFFAGESMVPSDSLTWFLLLANGVVMFGLTKVLWIESIHRISVTKAISLSSGGPALTILFAFIILKEVPTLAQLLALPPAAVGVYLLTLAVKERK